MSWTTQPRLRGAAVVTVTTLAAVTGALTGGLVGLDAGHPARQAAWLLLSAVAVAVATAVPSGALYRSVRARRRAQDLAAAAESRLTVTLDDALEPIATRLARLAALAAEPEPAYGAREAMATELKVAVLTTAARLVGEGRVRACLYRLTPAGVLEPDSYTGRGHPPVTVFRPDTVPGRAVLDLVRAGGSYFCHDVEQDAPHGWQPTASEYRTFLSVTVGAGHHRYGMLSLDAPDVGDLQDRDADLARVLAALLAAALPWAPKTGVGVARGPAPQQRTGTLLLGQSGQPLGGGRPSGRHDTMTPGGEG